jgi:hypothetical protein
MSRGQEIVLDWTSGVKARRVSRTVARLKVCAGSMRSPDGCAGALRGARGLVGSLLIRGLGSRRDIAGLDIRPGTASLRLVDMRRPAKSSSEMGLLVGSFRMVRATNEAKRGRQGLMACRAAVPF